MSDKEYSVILADPPWHFKNYSADAPGKIHHRSRGANRHYPTMTIEDICALTIPAADNAVLFLWACWPLLPEALQVIEAWGFEYKSLAWVWVKANPGGMGHYMGMGYWTRANSEPCLLARRGKGLKRTAQDVLALIYSPVKEHSRKPEEQYGKIERLFPGESYLELFARRKRAGWDAWGNEVEPDIAVSARNGISAERDCVTYLCQECGRVSLWIPPSPGPTPKYCEQCRPGVIRAQTRERQRRYRLART